MAAVTSQGTTVAWGSTSTADVRSVSVSSHSTAMVDATHLEAATAKALAGQTQLAQITVTALTATFGSAPGTSSEDLVIVYGASGTSVTYADCVLIDISPSVAVDTVVEWNYTFQQTGG